MPSPDDDASLGAAPGDRGGAVGVLDFELDRGCRLLGTPLDTDASRFREDLAAEVRQLLLEREPRFADCQLFASRADAVRAAIQVALCEKPGEVVRFRGCRHGDGDAPEPGPPDPARGRVRRFAQSDLGVRGVRELTFGDSATCEAHLAARHGPVAAVLVEPVPLAMGLAVPPPDFLPRLREACRAGDARLVLDEGASGLRFGPRGASERFGVEGDLIVYGESLAEGLPFGAALLRRSPSPPVQPTLPSEPALRRARECLLRIRSARDVAPLDSLGAQLSRGLEAIAADLDDPPSIVRFGSALGIYFPARSLSDPAEVFRYDWERHAELVRQLERAAIVIPNSPMRPLFLSFAHQPRDLGRALEGFERALELVDDAWRTRRNRGDATWR